jgi:kinesin family protein 18/19
LEVYNETIKDLLTSEDRVLDLREDGRQGQVIAGVSEVDVNSTSEIMTLLKIGNRNRAKEPTGANEESTRSHAIL